MTAPIAGDPCTEKSIAFIKYSDTKKQFVLGGLLRLLSNNLLSWMLWLSVVQRDFLLVPVSVLSRRVTSNGGRYPEVVKN